MKPGLRERYAYWLDSFMAKGARSLFIALVIVFLVGFVLISIAKLVFGSYLNLDNTDSGLSIWRIFLQLTDPGNMAQDNDSSWYIKSFAIVSGMFGIIFFSAVIAFITTQLDQKLENLKKGLSRVLEKNHVLILGWNNEIVEIIRELIIANESEKSSSIVILSSTPKDEMDDFLNEQIKDRKTTKIITRTGESSSLKALQRVAIRSTKSIIILPDCSPAAEEEIKAHSDAYTLKTVLAIVAAYQDKNEKPSIVAQIYNNSNLKIIKGLSPGNITIVDPEDMVAKIAVQTSRSSGLAAVYSNLVGFEGCEFYFTQSKWNSISFGDIQYHYPDGIVIGIRNKDGHIMINPSLDYLLQDSDDAIILAEDDSSIKFNSKALYSPKDIKIANKKLERQKEKVLIIGWNNKGKTIIEQYRDYILKGSEIHVVLSLNDGNMISEIDKIKQETKEHEINIFKINLLSIKELAKLSPETYNSIIILNTIQEDQEKADATTINILLLLREVIQKRDLGSTKTQIISEVMNSDNLEIISKTGVNDAIISSKMVSKILSQVADEPDVLAIYEEIFEEGGSEIYIKPLSLYLDNLSESLTFADCIGIAQKRNEICIGYRIKSDEKNVNNNFGIIINPPKEKKIDLTTDDSLIVLAEDEL